MPYQRVRLSRMVREQIRAWALPDAILKEVYLHLTEVMPSDPEHHLSRESAPFDGMLTQLVRRDPHTLGRDHEFVFFILLAPDEETLVVERGLYSRRDET